MTELITGAILFFWGLITGWILKSNKPPNEPPDINITLNR